MTDHDHHHQEHPHVHADGTACLCEAPGSMHTRTTAIDPVCGMTVDKEGAEHVATYQGQAYYFCSAGCRTTFLGNPREYISA